MKQSKQAGLSLIIIILIGVLIVGLITYIIYNRPQLKTNTPLDKIQHFTNPNNSSFSDASVRAKVKQEIKQQLAKASPTPIPVPAKITSSNDLNQLQETVNKVDIDNVDKDISSEDFD